MRDYWSTPMANMKQNMKCTKCGEVGFRYRHEKCDCKRRFRNGPN